MSIISQRKSYIDFVIVQLLQSGVQGIHLSIFSEVSLKTVLEDAVLFVPIETHFLYSLFCSEQFQNSFFHLEICHKGTTIAWHSI